MPELSAVSASSGFRGPGEARDPKDPQGTGKQAGPKAPAGADGVELSPDAQRLLDELKATDARVRAHEAAHLAAAGGLAKGGASFTFTRGPDGKQYAVGGEVSIDTGSVPGDPKATLAKAQRIQAAALAPSDPSPQDRAVASAAGALAAQAQHELSQQGGGDGKAGRHGAGSEGAKGLRLDLTI